MTATIKDIATRFARAVEGHSDPALAEIFAPKVISGHIYDEEMAEVDGPTLAAMMSHEPGFQRVMPDYKAAAPRLFCGEDGFALERSVSGVLRDGTKISYPFCAVATVKDGKIVRIDAYQDREQAAALGKAMEGLAAET